MNFSYRLRGSSVHRFLPRGGVFAAALCLFSGCSVQAQNTEQPKSAASSTRSVASKAITKTNVSEPVSPSPALPRMGINLNGIADWNTELPFVDVSRMSREWVSQKHGAGWAQGPKLDLDANGYIKSLESGAFAETLVNTVSRYPAGRYTVFYKGKGRLDVAGSAKKVSEETGKMVIDASGKDSIFLRLLETDPKDYIRDIRIVMPGFEETYQKQIFHPRFIERWRGSSVLRFMDWQYTNGSKQQKWANRPRIAHATWSKDGGVPLEIMIELSNRLNADPWFCMPHLADDDYVRNFARVVKARLKAKRRVYIEYSNEVWNGQFEQARYAAEKGIALGIAKEGETGESKPWVGQWHYTARRSVEIFKIWDEVFGGRTLAAKRLVRVLPSQAGNAYVSEQILKFEDAFKNADALAIAPYFSFNIPGSGDGINASEVATWDVNRVLDHMEQKALPESLKWIADNKKIADTYKVKLVSYEAGQHMVGIQGGENNEAVTKLLLEANRSKRMGDLYTKYLNGWKQNGGGLICLFASVGQWSKYGSWGLMQLYDDKPADYPKFVSTMNWAKAQGQPVKIQSASTRTTSTRTASTDKKLP